ncbi:MAG: hypothetical protein H8Z69_05850 [Nanohaloarchaea archaeon]|nr:hypothetical protein [Candidatus Nanohaloarchaea archaeon]
MMGIMIFCEGKNELKFFEKLCEKVNTISTPQTFDGQCLKHSRLKNQQSDKIRDLVGNPDVEVLVKAEGGKSNLKKVVPHFVPTLMNRVEKIILMADTDVNLEESVSDHKTSLMEFNNSIKNRIEQRHKGSKVEIKIGDVVNENQHLIINENYLLDRKGHRKGFFTTVLWKGSLESVSGINEQYSNVDEGLESLLRNDEIVNLFSSLVS